MLQDNNLKKYIKVQLHASIIITEKIIEIMKFCVLLPDMNKWLLSFLSLYFYPVINGVMAIPGYNDSLEIMPLIC
jgi:hypothetical protein